MPAKLLDWYRSTFGHALTGAALFWAALPPLGLWPLAWIAPVWWVLLVRRQQLPTHPPASPGRLFRPLPFFIALVVLLGSWMATVAWFHGRKYAGFWAAEIIFWPLALCLLVAAVRIWRRPYVALWCVGLFLWLAALHWLRLPHWATAFGWLAISFYFAFYLPVFVGLSRVAVHRLRVPVILAAPVVWTGLELARAHLLTGFTMGNLGHTQCRWVKLLQISDLTGDYGVSFVVMFVAACVAGMVRIEGSGFGVQDSESGKQRSRGVGADSQNLNAEPRTLKPCLWPLVPAAVMLSAVLGYGYWRTSGDCTRPGPRVALIQGNIDTQMKNEEGWRERGYQHYLDLSKQAIRNFGAVDVMVWPETAFFKETLVTCSADAAVPEEVRQKHPAVTSADFRAAVERELTKPTCDAIAELARDLKTPLILGVDQQRYTRDGPRFFNSAVYVDRRGIVSEQIYSKMHLVMFGEYVPFASYVPWLQRLTPLPISASPGERPEAFQLADVRTSASADQGQSSNAAGGSEPASGSPKFRAAPNICYETVISHVIRGQVNELRERQSEPDILVNLTNDGWFWGSNELEMHLACGVFRAVECRKPLLIAANTGISAWIDGDGRILDEAAPHTTDTLLARVRLDQRRSWYLAHGDWFAGACLAACVLLAAVGLWERLRRGGSSPLPRGKIHPGIRR